MDSDKKFWLFTAISAVALAAAYFLLVRPLQQDNAMKANELAARIKRLDSLAQRGSQLPNDKIVKKFQDYKDWLKSQEEKAREFFVSYDARLEADITGRDDSAPVDVKAAYIEGMKRWRRILKVNRIQFDESDFPSFPWEKSASLPDPEDYKTIFNRYWILDALFTQLTRRGHRAVAIEEIRFEGAKGAAAVGFPSAMSGMRPPTRAGTTAKSKTTAKAKKTLFDLIPVRISFLMRGEEVTRFLTDLMKRSRKNLPFLIRSLEITKIHTNDMKKYEIRFLPPPVRVSLDLRVVDFKTESTAGGSAKTAPKKTGK